MLLAHFGHHPIRISCLATVVYLVITPFVSGVEEAPRGTLETVVARSLVRQRVNDKLVPFASAGEVLPVLERKSDSVLVQSPDGLQGWVNLSTVVPLRESASVYSSPIKSNPTEANWYVMRGNVWAVRGDAKKAVDDYSMAIRLGSNDAELYVKRGVFLASLREFDKAIADYDRAVSLGSKDAAVFANRAAAYVARGKYDQAIEDYSHVISLAPDHAQGYVQRGLTYKRMGALEKAVEDFSKAIDLEPNNIQAVGNRGYAYYEMSDYEQAILDFTEAIRISPRDGVAYNNRGYNRQLLEDYRGAIEDYDKAIELAPEYALSYQNKAWLLATCPDEKIRDGEAALTTAITLCEMREYKVSSDLKSLAAAYAELGDFDNAVDTQTRVVEMTDEQQEEEEILKLYEAGQRYRMPSPTQP